MSLSLRQLEQQYNYVRIKYGAPALSRHSIRALVELSLDDDYEGSILDAALDYLREWTEVYATTLPVAQDAGLTFDQVHRRMIVTAGDDFSVYDWNSALTELLDESGDCWYGMPDEVELFEQDSLHG